MNYEKFRMHQDTQQPTGLQHQVEELIGTNQIYMVYQPNEWPTDVWNKFSDWAKVANYERIVVDGQLTENPEYIRYCAVLKRISSELTIKGHFMDLENLKKFLDRINSIMKSLGIPRAQIKRYFK